MNEREALKLALEALDCICSPLHVREITKVGNAMKAIREALAQPDQKPVVFRNKQTGEYCTGGFLLRQLGQWMPLYTTPPQREWVGLTDEERDHFEGLHLYAGRNQVEAWIEGVPAFIDAIEAKLREKNGC